MKKHFGLIALFAFTFACVAFGDASPLPSGVPAIAGTIAGASSAITTFVASAGFVAIASVVEMVLRLIPSQKPLSLLIAAAAITHAVGGFFDAAATALNSVIPQNVKPPGT